MKTIGMKTIDASIAMIGVIAETEVIEEIAVMSAVDVKTSRRQI
jgi:hypothetical protein